MKGITPVIAIVLLLMITISMVGFAFIWFTRVTELASQKTETQLGEQLKQAAMKIRIDSTATNSITIRNIGTETITGAQIKLYVNDVPVTCTFTDMAAGSVQTQTCTFTCSGTGATRVKVASPGNIDVVLC